MGRAKAARTAVAAERHFIGVLGKHRGADGSERLEKALRSAIEHCQHDSKIAVVEAITTLRLPTESANSISLRRQLRATLLNALTDTALAVNEERFREYAEAAAITPGHCLHIRVSHRQDSGAVLHIIADSSRFYYCGRVVDEDSPAKRGDWKQLSQSPFVHTHCPECALHATGINECEEDRAYPFFDDASAHSRVWKLTTNAVDFALESAVEDTQANPLELPDAAASAAVDAFLIVLAESMAAFSEQQIRTIISYSSVKAFTELAKTEDSPVFSQLLKFDDWHRICIDLNIPYEGFPRFTFNNFANSIRTRIRERILETASA